MSVTAQLLFKFHPFSQLAPDYLAKVIEASELRNVAKGKIVFQRGKSLSELYYLVDGDLNLVDASFESATLAASDPASQYALNEFNPSKASAVAASAVQVLIVERRLLDLVLTASEAGDDIPIQNTNLLDSDQLVSAQINYLDAYVDQPSKRGDQEDWMTKLLDAPLFDLVPAGNIQKLFGRFQPQSVAAGERVIEAGQEGDYFYVVASGTAQVMLSAGDPVTLVTGDYFGEEALVGDTTRNASVVMLSAGRLMRLAKSDFVELLQAPLFRYVELEQLAELEPQLAILDVRLPIEHRHFSVRGSRNISLGKLRNHLGELDPGLTYVVTDDAGSRSRVAVQLLLQTGLSAAILSNSDRGYQAGL